MNNLRIIIAFSLLALARIGVCSSLEDVFVSLYAEMNTTNTTQSAFMNAVAEGRFRWYDLYRAERSNMSDAALSNWFTNLVTAVVPGNLDSSGTNRWLVTKQYAIADMATDAAIRNSSNCWFVTAREHGLIRDGLKSERDWDVLLGVDKCEKEVMPDGVVIVSVPGLFGDQQSQREAMVRQMKMEQSWNEDVAAGMRRALEIFAKSDSFFCLSQEQHNSIVSNLVETARLTPAEAATLGLTNVTQQASN